MLYDQSRNACTLWLLTLSGCVERRDPYSLVCIVDRSHVTFGADAN